MFGVIVGSGLVSVVFENKYLTATSSFVVKDNSVATPPGLLGVTLVISV